MRWWENMSYCKWSYLEIILNFNSEYLLVICCLSWRHWGLMFTASIPESIGPDVLDSVVMVLGYLTLTVAQIHINNGIVEEMRPLWSELQEYIIQHRHVSVRPATKHGTLAVFKSTAYNEKIHTAVSLELCGIRNFRPIYVLILPITRTTSHFPTTGQTLIFISLYQYSII